jgi:hypothetical protein
MACPTSLLQAAEAPGSKRALLDGRPGSAIAAQASRVALDRSTVERELVLQPGLPS